MALIFEHQHRVSYSECTLGDHVYYARYLDILEVARGEFFRAIGLPFLRLGAEGIIFPVVECNLRYRAPARYDDLLRVEVWLSQLEGVRLKFQYRVSKEAVPVILEGWTSHVCTGLNERPKRVPEELSKALLPYLAEQVNKAPL